MRNLGSILGSCVLELLNLKAEIGDGFLSALNLRILRVELAKAAPRLEQAFFFQYLSLQFFYDFLKLECVINKFLNLVMVCLNLVLKVLIF